jgi:hypothetical protein
MRFDLNNEMLSKIWGIDLIATSKKKRSDMMLIRDSRYAIGEVVKPAAALWPLVG